MTQGVPRRWLRPIVVPLPGRGARLRDVTMPAVRAFQLRPELDLEDMPTRVTNATDPPYTGEVREEKSSRTQGPITPGDPERILCTLQRAWPIVGCGINPGDLPPGGAPDLLSLNLYALVRGDRILIAQTNISGGFSRGLINELAGAIVELAVAVPTTVALPVTGIRGSLWGQTLKR
jgi:hypothetical protein